MRTAIIGLAVFVAMAGGCRDSESKPEAPPAPGSKPASTSAPRPAPGGAAFVRPRAGEPGWIDVRCRLTVRSKSGIELEFINTSSSDQTFLLGTGRPPFTIAGRAGPGARPVIRARFARPLEFSADTFNAQPVSLAPGRARKVRLAWRAGKTLAGFVGKGAIPCDYRTMRKGPEGGM